MGRNWRVTINTAKSTAVVISRRTCLADRLYTGDNPLRWSPGVKYVGLHLDRRLTWRTHSEQVARKTASCLLSLLWSKSMARTKENLSSPRTVCGTDGYLRVPVWGYLVKTHKRKLQSLLDRGVR